MTTKELGKILGIPEGSQQARQIQYQITKHNLPFYKKGFNDWREIQRSKKEDLQHEQ